MRKMYAGRQVISIHRLHRFSNGNGVNCVIRGGMLRAGNVGAGTKRVAVRAPVWAQVLTSRLVIGALGVREVFEAESDLSPDG